MKISDLLELLLLAAVWGASFLFTRIAAPVLGPVLLIGLRVLIASSSLLLLSARLNLLDEVRQNFVTLAVVGCLNSAIPFLLFAFAALSLPAGFSSILNATVPLFGTTIAGIWLREKLTLSQFFGLIIGFVGVTTLIGLSSLPQTFDFAWAVAAGLVASLLYAIAAPYAKQKLSGIAPISVATGSQLGATVVLLPVALWFIPETMPSITAILAAIALGLFSTALAYVIYFRLLENIGVNQTLLVTYLIPPFAIFWGALILGEPITSSMMLGCALILSGTAIAVYQ